MESIAALIFSIVMQVVGVIFAYPAQFTVLTAFLVGAAIVCESADARRREEEK